MTDAQVISAVQEKGGAGKTTLIESLAALMVGDGARVVVIDTDDRKNLYRWADKKQIEIDYIDVTDDERLIPTVKALRPKGYDAIFIDTAGFKSAISIYAISASSLILIPTKADENDALGALRTFDHVQSVAMSMGVDKDISAYVVMMDIDKIATITAAVRSSLEAKRIPMLGSMGLHRTGIKEMKSTGRGPEGSAKVVMREILAELQMGKLINFYSDTGKWAKSA